MIALNLDDKTNRVLCAYEIPSGNYADGTVFVDSLPDGILYEYRYVDGKFIHDPLPDDTATKENISVLNEEPANTDTKISELEEKINQLQSLVNELSNKS